MGVRGAAIEPGWDLHDIITQSTSEIQVTGLCIVRVHG